MGHINVGGADGSIRRIRPLDVKRKIYVHQQFNPLLNEFSDEYAIAQAAG
jgi:pyrroloquinoline quinone biosynthesis protein B